MCVLNYGICLLFGRKIERQYEEYLISWDVAYNFMCYSSSSIRLCIFSLPPLLVFPRITLNNIQLHERSNSHFCILHCWFNMCHKKKSLVGAKQVCNALKHDQHDCKSYIFVWTITSHPIQNHKTIPLIEKFMSSVSRCKIYEQHLLQY